MTVKQYLKKHGWQAECEVSGGIRAMSVDIGFFNGEFDDETEFDISAYDEEELAALFRDFCKENQFPSNNVISIMIVKVAATMDELMEQ